MIQVINAFLGKFIDKFKAGSPLLYSIIALVLISIEYAVKTDAFASIIPGETEKTIIEIVTFIVALFVGSRTYKYIHPDKVDEKKN